MVRMLVLAIVAGAPPTSPGSTAAGSSSVGKLDSMAVGIREEGKFLSASSVSVGRVMEKRSRREGFSSPILR